MESVPRLLINNMISLMSITYFPSVDTYKTAKTIYDILVSISKGSAPTTYNNLRTLHSLSRELKSKMSHHDCAKVIETIISDLKYLMLYKEGK